MLRIILFIILPFISLKLFAQAGEPLIQIQTPNATEFQKFGNTPVSYYTGTPSISIPIHKIISDDIEVPISLDYYSGGNRVYSHPSWVGLGWNLNVGGVITRKINQDADEFKTKPYPTSDEFPWGYMYRYSKLNLVGWEDKLNEYCFVPGEINEDLRGDYGPDEFSFNFLGFSGSFFLDHTGKWKVLGEKNIKVEVFTVDRSQLRTQVTVNQTSPVINRSTRWIQNIVITTPDGVKYEFGGKDATEFSINIKDLISEGLTADAWYLAKITRPDGGEVKFIYQPDKLIHSLYPDKQYYRMDSKKESWWFGTSCSTTLPPQSSILNGSLQFPVYLKKIEYDGGYVDFTRSITTELKYHNDVWGLLYNYYLHERGFSTPDVGQILGQYFPTNSSNDIGWYKLNDITIYDYKRDLPRKKIKFDYNNDSNNRLKLISLTEGIEGYKKNNPYKFSYNSQNLPLYTSYRTDHWGFFNNNPTLDASFDFSNKEHDEAFMDAEILERIDYPTGGFTKYEYEPHSYSYFVNRNRNALTNASTIETKTGGLRIKRIETFSESSSSKASLIKEYYYKKGYSVGVNLNTLPSSGVLDVMPEYQWTYRGKDLDGNIFTIEVNSPNSVLTFGQNISGSHIGYSEVIEIQKDNSGNMNGYTVFGFTNFETDIWGNSHLDELGSTINLDRAVYSPIVSRQMERGKLLSESKYNNANFLLSSKLYKYERSSTDYIRLMKIEPTDICSEVQATRQTCFGTAYKAWAYDYRLKETTETINFQSSLGSLTKTITYSYDGMNQVKTEKEIVNNKEIVNAYTYPYNHNSTLNLTNYNIYNLNITKTTLSDGLLTGGVAYEYQTSGLNLGKPLKRYSYANKDLVLPPQDVFSNYLLNYESNNEYIYDNSTGKLREIKNIDGSNKIIIWGYEKQLPVAVIEGIDYNVISSTINQAILDNPLNDQQIRTHLSGIASTVKSNNGNITFYTYKPLFGISTSTDTNGIITYYNYDDKGRLKSIQDMYGNILTMYDYETGN